MCTDFYHPVSLSFSYIAFRREATSIEYFDRLYVCMILMDFALRGASFIYIQQHYIIYHIYTKGLFRSS